MTPFRLAPLLTLLLASTALADPAPPMQADPPPAIPTPRDVPYAGDITLAVDATDLDHHVFAVHESVPVAAAGDFILLYPKWIPGNHGPSGPLEELGGVKISAAGVRLPWVRDTVDMNALHVTVPDGAKSLDVDFQFLSPPETKEGRVVMTSEMLDLQWDAVVLYPAGYFSRGITMEPSLKLPAGWKFGSALEAAGQDGDTVTFKPVTLNTLVDSPLYAGHYFESVDLDPNGPAPVHLDVVADAPEDLAITPAELGIHRALIQQAYQLFGAHHYNHYDFLLELSDEMSSIGLEHHRSSEDGAIPEYFTDWEKSLAGRDLLAHEFTHSWNGKFRRPADLFAPNFNVPERDSLLWVYEGQTEYWGQVLAARSGLFTRQQALDVWALEAADMQSMVGRSWRALQDTTNDPIIAARRPQAWRSWQRSEDYYVEGLLIWLDADTLLRDMSHGQKSLDDFARGFFGMDDGSFVTKTYTFDDVVAALNAVEPYDWAKFLRTRLDENGVAAPLDGLARGGYRLEYTDKKSDYLKSVETLRKVSNFNYSVGLTLGKEATITAVIWNSPAFAAGLAVGTQIIAVNGMSYEDSGDLTTAIRQAKGGTTPIELLIKDGRRYRTVKIDYHGGLRYPHLARIDGTPALVDDLLAARGK